MLRPLPFRQQPGSWLIRRSPVRPDDALADALPQRDEFAVAGRLNRLTFQAARPGIRDVNAELDYPPVGRRVAILSTLRPISADCCRLVGKPLKNQCVEDMFGHCSRNNCQGNSMNMDFYLDTSDPNQLISKPFFPSLIKIAPIANY